MNKYVNKRLIKLFFLLIDASNIYALHWEKCFHWENIVQKEKRKLNSTLCDWARLRDLYCLNSRVGRYALNWLGVFTHKYFKPWLSSEKFRALKAEWTKRRDFSAADKALKNTGIIAEITWPCDWTSAEKSSNILIKLQFSDPWPDKSLWPFLKKNHIIIPSEKLFFHIRPNVCPQLLPSIMRVLSSNLQVRRKKDINAETVTIFTAT